MTAAEVITPAIAARLEGLSRLGDDRAATCITGLVRHLGGDPDAMPIAERQAMLPRLLIETGRDIDDVSPEVRELLDGGGELDETVSRYRPEIERAQDFFDANGVAVLTALFHASLPEAYLGQRGVQVLDATGELFLNWTRRIQETGQFLVNVLSPTPDLSRGGRSSLMSGEFGARAARRVRLTHAAIRWMLLGPIEQTPLERFESQLTAGVADLTEWKARLIAAGLEDDLAAAPLNQQDLLATLGTFTTVVFRALAKLGVAYDEDDRTAFHRLWNVVGWHLGIGDHETVKGDVGLPGGRRWPGNALLPIRADDMDAIYDRMATQLQNLERRPPEAGRRMAKALTQELGFPLPRALQGAPAFVARYLIGDAKADALAIEQGGIGELLVLRSGALEWWTTQARTAAFGRQAVGVVSQRITGYAVRAFIAQARWSDRGLTIDPHVAARWGIQIPPGPGPPARA